MSARHVLGLPRATLLRPLQSPHGPVDILVRCRVGQAKDVAGYT